MYFSPLFETAYWPPVMWVTACLAHDRIAIEGHEHYQKGGWRNRCLIGGPNGAQRLSIPLEKGKHQQTPIQEVRIAYDSDWRRQHWRSIRTAYGNAPFFEHYEADLAHLYEQKPVFLFDFNLTLMQWLWRKIGWKGEVAISGQYHPLGTWPHGQDYRGAIPAEGQSLPEWFDPLPYPQVFSERFGFQPNLSSLDLLMCQGRMMWECGNVRM